MSKPLFTVCLIVRNEEKTLPRLLESLSEFQGKGGEVVILDTGSSDNTVTVARDKGCNVHEVGDRFKVSITKGIAYEINKKFCVGGEKNIVKEGDTLFDYSSARNYAAGLCNTDIVAMPDADEIYTKFDIDKINEEIEKGVDQFEYAFVFSHDTEGNELVKFNHSKFYNRKKLKWVGIIHEVLQGTDVNRKFFDESVIKLEHYQNHETDRSGYLKGLAYDCYLDPSNDRNSHYFARELYYHGYLKSAIKEFERHISMQKWDTERSESLCYIGKAKLLLGETDDAIASFTQAFHIEPRRREPFMHLAEYYYKNKMSEHALVYAAAATQIPDHEGFYANYQPYYQHIPHEILYWAYWQRGDFHSSRYHFETALAYQPYNSKYLHDLRFYTQLPKVSFIIPTLGRPEGLKRCINSIKNLNYPRDRVEIIVVLDGGEHCVLPGENIEGVQFFLNSDRIGVPKSVKIGVEKSTGEWIVYASNDIEFEPDSLIYALRQAQSNAKGFMAFNTGEVTEDEGNICEHFMIKRDLLKKLKIDIFDTDFNHVGADNLLWERMKLANQAMRCLRAVVHHYHFSKTGEPMDEVYKLAWDEKKVEEDRKLLKEKLDKLYNRNNDD